MPRKRPNVGDMTGQNNSSSDEDEDDEDEDQIEETGPPDFSPLQQELGLIFLGTPSAVNALSKNRGPCDICGETHPTLRCHFLWEENISPAICLHFERLKLQLEK